MRKAESNSESVKNCPEHWIPSYDTKKSEFLVSFDSITKNWKWFAEGALCISKQKFYELTQIPDSLPSSSLEYFGLNIIRSFNKNYYKGTFEHFDGTYKRKLFVIYDRSYKLTDYRIFIDYKLENGKVKWINTDFWGDTLPNHIVQVRYYDTINIPVFLHPDQCIELKRENYVLNKNGKLEIK
jgi:hypothetical protein